MSNCDAIQTLSLPNLESVSALLVTYNDRLASISLPKLDFETADSVEISIYANPFLCLPPTLFANASGRHLLLLWATSALFSRTALRKRLALPFARTACRLGTAELLSPSLTLCSLLARMRCASPHESDSPRLLPAPNRPRCRDMRAAQPAFVRRTGDGHVIMHAHDQWDGPPGVHQ